MRKLHRLAILALFLLSACTTPLSKFEPVQNQNGHWTVKEKGTGDDVLVRQESVMRESDGSLVKTKEAAQDFINNSGVNNFDYNRKVSDYYCSANSMFQASKNYNAAIEKIKAKEFDAASELLNKAKEECDTIGNYSNLYYLQAVIALSKNEQIAARGNLENYLKFSSATKPDGFYEGAYLSELIGWHRDEAEQEKHLKNTKAQFEFYQTNAKSFLANKQTNLPLSQQEIQETQEAKMYANSPFAPGGNPYPSGIYPMLSFGYGTVSGLTFSGSFFKSWGIYSLTPAFLYTSEFGTIYSLKASRHLYQSSNRDLNIETFIYGNTWKKVIVRRSSLFDLTGTTSTVDSGVNYGAGVGATKRLWVPNFGLSSEVYVEQDNFDNVFRAGIDAYAFYDLFSANWSVFAGYLSKDMVVGMSLLNIKIGYNIDDDNIYFRVNGLSF